MRNRKRKLRRRAILVFFLFLAFAAFAAAAWFGCQNRHLPGEKIHSTAPSSPPAQTIEPPTPAEVSPEAPPAPSAANPGVAFIHIQPTPPVEKTSVAAIIIDDLGNNWEMDRRFVESDIPLTLAVLPHCAFSERVAEAAGKAGKPIILHLPMEPLSGGNPGPGKITASMNSREVQSTVEDDLKSVPGVEGISNHQGSKATAVAAIAAAVAEIAGKRHLYIVDSLTSPDSVFSKTAHRMQVKTTSRQIFLDNRDDPEYIKGQLRELIRLASEKGEALAIGHVRKNTLRSIEEMLPAFEAAKVRLVYARDLLI
ncbi:MAG: divergent polysaccharide deacetylase family protein [bacterium]